MNALPATLCYLDGDFLPLNEAKVSVMDRGFLFGDGAYESIPVYRRRLFRFDDHLARLARSLAKLGIEADLDRERWLARLRRVVEAHPAENQQVYLQVTRGVAKRDHAFPAQAKPTVFVMSGPLATPARELVENGVPCITGTDFRWLKCDVKSVSLLGNCLLRQSAADAGAAEIVLFRGGHLTEASASNVFVVRRGTLLSPPKTHLILPGITYDVVLELAAAVGIPLELRDIPEAEVRGADELWLTSSTREVQAIVSLDGKPVGAGKPGPLFRKVYQAFQEFKRKVMRQAA